MGDSNKEAFKKGAKGAAKKGYEDNQEAIHQAAWDNKEAIAEVAYDNKDAIASGMMKN